MSSYAYPYHLSRNRVTRKAEDCLQYNALLNALMAANI